jgi:hypothetical protein
VFGCARYAASWSAIRPRRVSIIAFSHAWHAKAVGIETALTTIPEPVALISGAGMEEDPKMLRPLIAAVVISAAFTSSTPAQNASATATPDPAEMYWTQLTFSKDGRIFRETGSLDGRAMVIAADVDMPDARAHLFLLDADTGDTQDIPREWFDADETRPSAAISGDGRLVSIYSEWSPEYQCMLVKIYDWRTKTLVAKQTRGEFAGGFSSGAVTEDGKIVFSNNRSGSYIVDPTTGQTLLHLGNDAFRSPNGAWVVEFPDRFYGDSGTDVTIRDGENGRVLGKLDLPMSEDEAEKPWQGAFCGASGKFVAVTDDMAVIFAIPSGKKIASFSVGTWRDTDPKGYPLAAVACTSDGKRVAIRSGSRITFHSVK